jgi:hypothetical protein
VAFLGLTLHANELRLDGVVSRRDLRMVEASLDWPDGRWVQAVIDLKAAGLVVDEGPDVHRLVPFFGLDRHSRDAAAARQKRYRDKKKGITSDGVTDDVTRDVAVTPQSKRKRKSKEIEAEVALSSNGHAQMIRRSDVDEICGAFVASLEKRDVVKRAVTPEWRDAARLMLDKDGRELPAVLDVITWLTSDSFWRGNILSLPTLREKFDQVRLHRGRANGLNPIDRNARELIARGGIR